MKKPKLTPKGLDKLDKAIRYGTDAHVNIEVFSKDLVETARIRNARINDAIEATDYRHIQPLGGRIAFRLGDEVIVVPLFAVIRMPPEKIVNFVCGNGKKDVVVMGIPVKWRDEAQGLIEMLGPAGTVPVAELQKAVDAYDALLQDADRKLVAAEDEILELRFRLEELGEI